MTSFPMGPVTVRARGGRTTVWSVLAVVAVIAAVLVTVKVAWTATAPAFPYDEIDQLQMSRLLAGLDTPELRGAGYFPGWSLVITPLWWLTSDPMVVYRGAIVIGAVLGLGAIVPLAFITRRFRLSAPQALTAAAVIVTLPAAAIQADYALSERMLLLTVACTVLAAWRLWERPGIVRAVVFALLVALVYFTHVRMLALVLAAGIWLILFALHNWRAALVGLASLIVFALAARYLGTQLNVLLLGEFSQGENLLESLLASRPGLLLRSALGQAWTQLVGTLGLAAIGFVTLIVWTWRELRRLRAGRATFLLAIVLAMYLLTTVKWASDYHLFTRPWHRLDTWLYGRYIDPVTVLLVLVALAVVFRGIRRSVLLWSGGVALAVILPTVFWVAREAPTWGYVTPAHIPGITPWAWLLPDNPFPEGTVLTPTFTNENRFWIYGSLCVIVAFVVIHLLRRVTWLLALVLLIAFSAMSWVGDAESDRFREIEGVQPAGLPALQQAIRDAGGADVDFAGGCTDDGSFNSVTLNYYGYWLLPGIVHSYAPDETAPDGDVIVACSGTAPSPSAVAVPGLDYRGTQVWIAPGPVADALRAQGVID